MAGHSDYIQMPLTTFLSLNPEYIKLFPLKIFSDPRYVVRISQSTGTLEVGYPGDCWTLN